MATKTNPRRVRSQEIGKLMLAQNSDYDNQDLTRAEADRELGPADSFDKMHDDWERRLLDLADEADAHYDARDDRF